VIEYSDQRYLLAKKPVDDRALSRPVLSALGQELSRRGTEPPVIVELGAGVGTMVCRLTDWGVIQSARYTLVDRDRDSLLEARRHLFAWGRERLQHADAGDEPLAPLDFGGRGPPLSVCFEHADALDFLRSPPNRGRFDLVVANAVLDLVDLAPALRSIWCGLKPGAPYWFSINFDGDTIFLPETGLDEKVMQLFHRTMDERVRDGKPCGDSRTGRHLLEQIPASGATLLAAGSSDWVVFPRDAAYPNDEAYFLHHLVHTLDVALQGSPELPAEDFVRWVKSRHAQVERGELIYVAHQLDAFGLSPRVD
jgi:hypothetical protein